jgi:hypothetical protein
MFTSAFFGYIGAATFNGRKVGETHQADSKYSSIKVKVERRSRSLFYLWGRAKNAEVNIQSTLLFQETRIKVACVITTLIQITINVYTSSQDA